MAEEPESDLLAARRRKLEALRAAGLDPFPARVSRGRADRRRARAARAAGRRGGDDGLASRGRAPRRPARPGQDGVPRPGRSLGADPAAGALGRARNGGDGAAAVAGPGRPDRRRRDRVSLPPGRAHAAGRQLRAARQVAAPAPREAPWPEGRGDPVPLPRARSDRQPRGARAVHPPREGDLSHPALPRRAGLRRGRDAGAPAPVRRGGGASLHHPPQRAGSRFLPAYRHRALPQAADRGRARARVRARQGLPQRGGRHHPQPRVHDARVLRGVRRLQRHRAAVRAARGLRRGGGRVLRRDRSLGAVEAGDDHRGHPDADRDRHRRVPGPGGAGGARCARAG